MTLCAVCNDPITGRRADAKTCVRHKDFRVRPRPPKSAATKAKNKTRTFVSIDGEATTQDGKYGLIAASDGKTLANRQGLSTEQMLDFILALPKHYTSGGGKPIYVGFAIDYDVNQILGDLPLFGEHGSIEELRRESETRWRGYVIRYYHRKIFRVSRGKKTTTIYDTWGYFQSTFETALAKWGIPVPPIISEGKKARGADLWKWPMNKIIEYNRAELEQHKELMNRLRDSIKPLDLSVPSWHGPAALAGYWLGKNKVQEYQSELSPNLSDVASRAYFGGRIDVRGYGLSECFHYDLVSAYPSATRFLPDLPRLRWRRMERPKELSGLYCAHIRWQVPPDTLWPPFPWRNHTGTIRYPTSGEGWYWFHELEAAREIFGDCYEVLEAYQASGDIIYPLKGLIENTFEYRAELKRQGNPSHVPVKLILNSIYGKFAQTVGAAKYHNLVWAGLITSYTRAELMRRITPHTLCVMTDSLWTKQPLQVNTGEALGDWERQPENRVAIAEAGLYQAWTRKGETTIWQRGFDRKMPVDVERLVSEWVNGDPLYSPTYRVHRFIGMGLASITNYPWRTWMDLERTIHPVPLVGTTKRLPYLPDDNGIRTGRFVTLYARPADREECSSPYKNATIDPELIAARLTDECTEGGD